MKLSMGLGYLHSAADALQAMVSLKDQVYHVARQSENWQWMAFSGLLSKYHSLAAAKQQRLDALGDGDDFRRHEIAGGPEDARYIVEKMLKLFGMPCILEGIRAHTGCDVELRAPAREG